MRGDTAKFRIAITNVTGAPLPLDPYTDIEFSIKRSTQDSDAGAIFNGKLSQGLIVIEPSPAVGIIAVTVPAEIGNQLRMGRPYFWDVQIRDADENTFTPIWGDLLADNDVSNA